MKTKLLKIEKESGLLIKNHVYVLSGLKQQLPGLNVEMLDEMIVKYKRYLFHKSLEVFGIEERFISKDKKPDDFGIWAMGYGYKNEYPMPKTTLTKYLFGDQDFYDIVDRFNEIDNNIKKQRAESIKKHNYGRFIV